MQDSAASLAVPLAASLLGCLAVLALVGLVLALYARHRRRRSGAVSAQKKGEALPVTVSAGAPQQVQAPLFLLGIVVTLRHSLPKYCTAHHSLQNYGEEQNYSVKFYCQA